MSWVSFISRQVVPPFAAAFFFSCPVIRRSLRLNIPKNAMKNNLTRRSFVKGSAIAAGVFATAPFNILNAANAGEKVRFAQIGCGGRGMAHLGAAVSEQLVA